MRPAASTKILENLLGQNNGGGSVSPLFFKPLEPARRDVVLDVRRGGVRSRVSRKPFSHLVVFPLGFRRNAPAVERSFYFVILFTPEE